MKKKFMSFLAFMIISVMSCSVVFADETTVAGENQTTAAETETTTAAKEEPTTVVKDMKEQLASYGATVVKTLSAYTETKLDYYIDNTIGFENDMYSSYKTMITEVGDIVESEPAKVMDTDNGYKLTMKVKCEKGNGQLSIVFGYIDGSLVTTDVEFKSIAENEGASIGNAALNTVMGMTTVVAVLVLILFIISLFAYTDTIVNGVSKIFKKKETRKEEVNEAIDQVVARIEVNESNDLELIAVITAAIAAQTGQSTDSFVVRKIKRR